MSFALLIIGGLLLLGGIAFLIYNFVRFNKDPLTDAFTKKDWINFVVGVVAVGLGLAGMLASAFEFNPAWKEIVQFEKGALAGRSVSYIGNYLKAILGGFFFGVSFATLWTSFSVVVAKRKLTDFYKKFFKWAMLGAIVPSVILFFVWTDAFGAYISYPLPSGIYIGDGVGVFNAFNKGSFGGLKVAFYAIFILSGAGISYAVTDYRMNKKFKKHDLFATTLIFGFVSGILGARIWYVVGNWAREFANEPFHRVFEIWNGGLTVLGGVFLGVLVGAIWFAHEHKELDCRSAFDIAVPTILLAQALGRLGNFTNVEVYGQAVKVEGLWNLLPSYILQQMNLSNGGGMLPDGMIHVPLFLIEALLNLGGYFIIVYLVPALLKKKLAPGDLLAGYFIWYGLVRFILEPFRDANFNMGSDNSWSICNSLIYIIVGLGIIASTHLFEAIKNKKDKGLTPLWSSLILLPTLLFPLLQSISLSTKKDGSGVSTPFTGFEIMSKTPIYIVAYALLGLALICFIVQFVLSKKEGKEKICQYLSIGGMSLSVLSALLMIFGQNTIEANGKYVNLSYGFFLMISFALVATGLSLMPLLADLRLKRIKKEEALETQSE